VSVLSGGGVRLLFYKLAWLRNVSGEGQENKGGKKLDSQGLQATVNGCSSTHSSSGTHVYSSFLFRF